MKQTHQTAGRAEALAQLTDEQLVCLSRDCPEKAVHCLDVLFERVYPRVAKWCLHRCGDRDQAADLAQDVILRAYTKLDSYRLESKFCTWLYTVSRRVAIDRGIQRRREESRAIPDAAVDSVEDPGATTTALDLLQLGAAVRSAMMTELEPDDARVIYLHYVDGCSLPDIRRLLELDNRSGAKAYLVRGMRKLRLRFIEIESETSRGSAGRSVKRMRSKSGDRERAKAP